MALITPAELRVFAPTLAGTADDARQAAAIAAADRLAALHCGYPPNDDGVHTLESSDYTVYGEISALHDRQLRVGVRPITEVTSVHVSEDWTYAAADEIDTADVAVEGSFLWLAPNATRGWSTSPRANRAVVVAGHPSTPDTPEDLGATIALIAVHLLTTTPADQSSVTAGGQSASRVPFAGALPESLAARLAPYRLGGSYAA